jgi:hypothetical protein
VTDSVSQVLGAPVVGAGCDFSLDHYRHIIATALQSGYQIIRFDDLAGLRDGVRACILRHDVDYFVPEDALKLGKIDADLGVRSTFFFLVASEAYNVREPRCYRTVRALADMGHVLGLHVDPSWDAELDPRDIAGQCAVEREAFRILTGIVPTDIVSLHNPHKRADSVLGRDLPGIRHVYESRYFSEIKYLSDSQGWYEGCVCRIFEARVYERIQLLIHPYLWSDRSGGFVEDMVALLRRRSEQLLDHLVEGHPVARQHERELRRRLRAAWR